MKKPPRHIGLISDTHGLLRKEALEALQGVDLILHAGDVGDPKILPALETIAPVHAVRGNVDTAVWASAIPATCVVEAGPGLFYMLHNLHDLDLNPAKAGFHVVVTGHSHKPSRMDKDGVLYLNPGSAGPRRFSLPICLARMDLAADPWEVELVDLETGRRQPLKPGGQR